MTMEHSPMPTAPCHPSRPTRRSSLLGWPKVNTFLSFSVGRLAEEAVPERTLVQKSGRDLKKKKKNKVPSKTPCIPSIITLNAHEDWIHHNFDNDDDELYHTIQKEQQEDETTTSTTSSRSKVIQSQSISPMIKSSEKELTQRYNTRTTKMKKGTEESIVLTIPHHLQHVEVEEGPTTDPVHRAIESNTTQSDCTAPNEISESTLTNTNDPLQSNDSVDTLEEPVLRRPRPKKVSPYAELAKELQEKMDAKNLKRSTGLVRSR